MNREIRNLIEFYTWFFSSEELHSGQAEVRTAAFNCKVQQQNKGAVKSSF
jgi:hypothetical protein